MIIIYVLLGVIVIVLLLAALMPNSYNVEQSTVVHCPPAHAMNYVTDLNNYSKWNPWQQMEPGAAKTISGSAGVKGHRYEWQGKKIGMGSLTLKNADDRHVQFDLQFLKPWKTTASDNWVFEPWGNGEESKITWQNSGKLPWPMARLMGPMINRNLNHQFKKGLDNLKTMCEEKTA